MSLFLDIKIKERKRSLLKLATLNPLPYI